MLPIAVMSRKLSGARSIAPRAVAPLQTTPYVDPERGVVLLRDFQVNDSAGQGNVRAPIGWWTVMNTLTPTLSRREREQADLPHSPMARYL